MQTDELAARSRPRIGLGMIALIGAGGVLALVTLLALGFWMNGRRGLNAEFAKIRAAGEPASAAELEQFYAAPTPAEDTTQLWLDAIAPLDTPQFLAEAKNLPVVGEGVEPIPWPGDPWAEEPAATALLTQYRRSLELMHQAAKVGGQARFPTRFAEGFSMLLSHAQQLRGGARLLSLESAVAARQGRPVAAVDAVVAIFAAARSLEREPLLISQLVRMALTGIARQRLAWLLSALSLDDAQLARLDAELAALDYRQPLRTALIGERVMGIEAFANPATVGDEQLNKLSLISGSRDETTYLSLMSELIAAADLAGPALEKAMAAHEAQLRQLTASRISALRHPFTVLLLPATRACFEAADRNEAERDAARAAVAIERFSLESGRLPQTLAELTPELLKAVPADPFGGASLHYRIHAAEYVVYSVGKDRVDQQGLSEPAGQADDVAVRIRRKDAAASAPASP